MRSVGTIIVVVGCCALSSAALAQTDSDDPFRVWLMYFGDHRFDVDSKWGFHFDGQYRVNQFGSGDEQLLLRPGINFDATDTLQLSGGYAFIRDAAANGFDVPEHRFWEQLILRQRVGSVGLLHRYRFEQRLVGSKVPGPDGEGELDGYRYRNRFRYFLKATIPVGSDGFYVGAYNELMLNFGTSVTDSVFDQNRSYVALGHSLGRAGNVEIGYLLQLNQSGTGGSVTKRHILQVGFFSSAPISQ